MAEGTSDKVMHELGRLIAALDRLANAIYAEHELSMEREHDEAAAYAQPGGPLPADRAAGPGGRAVDGSFHAATSCCVPLNPSSEISDKFSPKIFGEKSKGPSDRENGSPAFPEGVLRGPWDDYRSPLRAEEEWRTQALIARAERLRGRGQAEREDKARMSDDCEQAGKEAYSGYRLPDLPADQDGLPDLPKGDAGVVPKVDAFKDWYVPGRPWWRKW